MDLVVRDANESDFTHIFALWHDPAILKEQYPLSSYWSADSAAFRSYLVFPRNWFGEERRCTAILVDGDFAGCVLQQLFTWTRRPSAVCGWNLLPSHWGRGIMPRALTLVFDRLFLEASLTSIVADCFSTNTRCQRVLDKLGFERESLGWLGSLEHFVNAGFRHRVWRHRLTAERWKLQSAEFNDSIS